MRRTLAALLGTTTAAAIALGAAGAAQAAPIIDPNAPVVSDILPGLTTLTPEELADLVTPPNCPPGKLFVLNGGQCFAIA
ncbi:hypothetical protein RAJCM14343_4045 [Rhodococcus aetherivorans]|uniref:Secreted protein n=1 Tax=Rhodococcus aetherivorans TaxID=191292 RepID=A0ABQ0YQA6_9NOCA|nr:hypothetical protein [Rhodococcus aetherivorans]ETT23565.1 hypothetical protein RR21198_5446 [Rhodococcus rhodochrous ATCC 21198]KDE12488.1 hypothetical protein N505_0115700 [Rhodococcus aetherivorans]MDV6296675.1 hypothetical protein [Rhodococcus aetherivorans]NGP28327.1 hypothetical protein [Rhodococcus aetherivorans]GES38779.1 hypothetical protein RAJCM14343_4045 [Rhodococcus aetherivorans]